MNMLMFPGQGSQLINMGIDLFNNFPYVQDYFYSADEAISLDLSRIIFEGDADELKQTSILQPAIMIISIIVLIILEKEHDLKIENISLCAGHSLGEYTALCATKSISFIDCVKLLYARGIAMQEASPENTGMAAIIGSDIINVEKIILDLNRKSNNICIANDNCTGQIIVSGYKNFIEKLSEYKEVKKLIPINVSGPFHSKLMIGALEKLKNSLEHVTFHKPKTKIIHNIYGGINEKIKYVNDHNVEGVINIKDVLLSQLTSRVRWRETMLSAQNFGIKNYYELGCGNVLTGLAKKTLVKDGKNCAFDNAKKDDDIDLNFFNIYSLDSLKNFILK